MRSNQIAGPGASANTRSLALSLAFVQFNSRPRPPVFDFLMETGILHSHV
jgi:hypothetical protein